MSFNDWVKNVWEMEKDKSAEKKLQRFFPISKKNRLFVKQKKCIIRKRFLSVIEAGHMISYNFEHWQSISTWLNFTLIYLSDPKRNAFATLKIFENLFFVKKKIFFPCVQIRSMKNFLMQVLAKNMIFIKPHRKTQEDLAWIKMKL